MFKSRVNKPPAVEIGRRYDAFGALKEVISSPLSDFKEQLETYNNPGWRKRRDAGGNFTHSLYRFSRTPSESGTFRTSAGLRYEGAFACQGYGAVDPSPTGLHTWGPTAFNRMKPTKPLFSLFNFVYELKDLPGQITQLQRGFQRSLGGVGDWYLSQVFGWIPFLDDSFKLFDLYQTIETQQKLQKRIDFLLRNQGKWVPTRCTLRDDRTTTMTNLVDDWGALAPVLTTQFYSGVPRSKYSLYTQDHIWAEARFKWFLPEPIPGVKLSDTLRSAMRGNHSIRVHQLYRAVPWTWLVDWALGLARILENADAGIADKLAADRFYIMREQRSIYQKTGTAKVRLPSGGYKSVFSSVFQEYTLKQRIVGSPFYPGNPSNLTNSQLAILGALGLSRYG